MLRLYTFHISHFSEKARWALDYAGVPFEEKVLLPGPHILVTRRVAPDTQVPLLQHDDKYVQGSGAIIDYIDQRLGGSGLTPSGADDQIEARQRERQIDEAFGLGVQRVVYNELLQHRDIVSELWAAGGPPGAVGSMRSPILWWPRSCAASTRRPTPPQSLGPSSAFCAPSTISTRS
ncbi:MAG TPA: glutathione S-transferase N-terminal domain-containing protein [Terriglobales bacterium]|nr:glutathione S-transferase N-terminal domain-containing protein [Terriglobales bacterium]